MPRAWHGTGTGCSAPSAARKRARGNADGDDRPQIEAGIIAQRIKISGIGLEAGDGNRPDTIKPLNTRCGIARVLATRAARCGQLTIIRLTRATPGTSIRRQPRSK